MANKSCACKITLTYEGPDSTTLLETSTITATYQSMGAGVLDVPDLEAGSTSHSVPFGGIGTGATCVLVKNRTGQDLDIKINGAAAASHGVKSGGITMISMASLPTANKLTALALITTGTQAGAGYIDYFVFGDPT